MSLGEEARLSALDAALHAQESPDSLAADLFAVVDVLDSSAALRRAISDPGSPPEARRGLVHGLFDGKISEAAVSLTDEAAALRWSGGRTFVAAIERQAARAELLRADAQGQLEETEDEMFRFARLVESNPGLREALADRTVGIAHRRNLVAELLEGKATEATISLAKRAVAARERTFGNTLEGFVSLAATMKNRLVATVRVAKPLTSEQTERLQASLSRQVGREVYIQVVIDERVVGGARVTLGGEVIEGSVAARIEEARRLFS